MAMDGYWWLYMADHVTDGYMWLLTAILVVPLGYGLVLVAIFG